MKTRILSIISIIVITAISGHAQPLTPAPDVNGDGVVDHDDLFVIQNYWQTGEKYTPTVTPTPTITQTPTPTPTLGTFTVQLPDDATMELCEIPAGSFIMGALNYEGMWNFCFDIGQPDCSRPIHDVTFESSFYMGKTEVTRAQWYAVMGSLPDEIVNDGPDTRPVNYVSWNDAQEFVTMLNNLGQGTFRLPSEAEWEYACRAGTRTRFYFGDSDCVPKYYGEEPPCNLNEYAWWKMNSTIEGHPVGQKLPNAWNLYDMHGNIAEFCQDDWHNNFTGAPTDGSAWIDGLDLTVMRGGHIKMIL